MHSQVASHVAIDRAKGKNPRRLLARCSPVVSVSSSSSFGLSFSFGVGVINIAGNGHRN